MRVDVPIPALSGWERVPARRLFEHVHREPRDDDEIITAFRDGEVTLRSNRRVTGFTNAVQEIGYQGIRAGDLVVHSMDGFAGAIGVSDSAGKASPVVHCYLPGSQTDPRYYAYLLRTLAQRDFITSLAKGIRERSTGFDAETFRSLVVPNPTLAEQRAIADYLDIETTRINALIAKKQQLVHLLEERVQVVRDNLLTALGDQYGFGPVAALALAVVDCVNKTAPVSTEPTGFLMIRTSNVRNGVVDLTDVFHVDEPTFVRWTRRGRPCCGDVLLTREAPVGEVGVLKDENAVFLGQRLMMYRPDYTRSSSDFLAQALQSLRVKDQIALLAAGSLHEHLRVGDCSKLSVPLAPLDAQNAALAEMRYTADRALAAVERLLRQVALLTEHRQAVVTAAVAGELRPLSAW